jgi:hypothetical protein
MLTPANESVTTWYSSLSAEAAVYIADPTNTTAIQAADRTLANALTTEQGFGASFSADQDTTRTEMGGTGQVVLDDITNHAPAQDVLAAWYLFNTAYLDFQQATNNN